MKRILALILLFALLMSFGAYADVAFEPDDDFYWRHSDECDYENRNYIANSPEGYVLVYDAPDGAAADALPNGEKLYISWVWNDWGCAEYQRGEEWETGWVALGSMTAEYDSTCFREDHGDEISDEGQTLMIRSGQEFIGYKYPGSGLVTCRPGSFSGDDYTTIYIDGIYTDASGSRWGYVGYFFGYRDFWINLDSTDIQLGPGPEYTEPEIIPAADEDTMQAALRESSPFTPYVIAGAIGVALIAAAVVCFMVIKKRSRRI